MENNLKSRFDEYLIQRKAIHINDSFLTYKKWNELIEMLSENENQTIKLINSASKDEIDYISEIMEEVAGKLNSNKYIDALKDANIKYPESNLDDIIEISITQMTK